LLIIVQKRNTIIVTQTAFVNQKTQP
jgi:hypothetical protein